MSHFAQQSLKTFTRSTNFYFKLKCRAGGIWTEAATPAAHLDPLQSL